MTKPASSLICVGKQFYKLRPQPEATPNDVLEILALLDWAVTPERYQMLPESVRRHFSIQPTSERTTSDDY
jgi:hypothetical protein